MTFSGYDSGDRLEHKKQWFERVTIGCADQPRQRRAPDRAEHRRRDRASDTTKPPPSTGVRRSGR
ncbi:hypothetical protein DV706_05830 [Natronorubrum bangense]|uniref:Uncharacterized protein n=2 Tax=Natronorubrum bangense TaxID=61858 RepID=L9WIB9_9EURY|nr:hypothetical protein C494_09495 [Natronorubrum bangense JCM 10635]QCC54053.1 hypothetical protein DV706_05830 [Natronorubrum bangense]